MRLRAPLTAMALGVTLTAVAACGSDTDAETTAPSDGSTGPASSGAEYDAAALQKRVDDYQAFLVDEADTMVAATTIFTDAVRAGDLAKAKASFGTSRYHWETIEPLAGLVSTVDGEVDSRVDDFASVDDPAFTGWHRLEYILWEKGTIDASAKSFATTLDRDLAPLPRLLGKLQMDASDVATGAAGLIEEVSEGKLTGEEDRYSHTDLYDIAANVNGSLRAFQTYEPTLLTIDKPLELKIEQGFLDAKSLLNDYQNADGSYQSYLDLSKTDKQKLQALLATLSEDLSQVPGVLSL